MSATHSQVNKNGQVETRATTLWPSSKKEQAVILRSFFENDCWNVESIENESGSHWQVVTSSAKEQLKINLYVSSVRDEDRNIEEFKMQLGSSYPTSDVPGWITMILGVYTISPSDGFILVGYTNEGYNYATNPSLRWSRTKDLQNAQIYGMSYTEKSCIFRPEFLYHYIKHHLLRQTALQQVETVSTELETVDTSHMDNFIRALKTKPFLLLAGISGTGKSQKVKELAYLTCPKDSGLRDDITSPGNYCLIEVKPNWHDSTELLGYYSNLSGKYDITPFIKFVYKAKHNKTIPFFVCLDEMNLAPVEQYFAEYLSVLETRVLDGGEIKSAELLKKDIFQGCQEEKGEEKLYTEDELAILRELKSEGLRLPENLFIVGTVNMDDTTHQFSRKVIDRAFTIEMNGDKLSSMFETENPLIYRDNIVTLEKFKPKYVKASDALDDPEIAKFKETIIKEVPEKLNAINEILQDTPFKVSFRVQNELVLYLSTLILEEKPSNEEEVKVLIDEAMLVILLEKILPRVQGDQNLLGESLDKLLEHIRSNYGNENNTIAYNSVITKLNQMSKQLQNAYFTNFF